MKTNTIYTALVATIATVLTFTATNVASAQSSSRRNNSGGNTTATQRSSDNRQKAAQVSQPRANNNNSVQDRKTSTSPDRKPSTPQNRTTDNKKSSSDRTATQSRGNHNSGVNTGRNYNDHMGNVRTQSGIDNKDRKPNNGNVTNRPDNKPNNNGNVTNRPDNKPNNNRPEARPEKDRKPNGNVTNRPGKEGPRPTYYAGRGGNSATKLPPAPKFDRANPNRHLGYNPFRDGRIIHRPAAIHIDFDLGLRFLTRPRHYYKYRINGMSMYFWNGVWYWHAYGYYNVHRPPVGTRIPISDIAPYLYEVDYDYYSGINTRTYYVDSYANFYVQVNSYELQVVNAPDGAVLYDMPSDYKELVYDGSVYYVIGNSIFEYVYSNANSWYFRAVGIYR